MGRQISFRSIRLGALSARLLLLASIYFRASNGPKPRAHNWQSQIVRLLCVPPTDSYWTMSNNFNIERRTSMHHNPQIDPIFRQGTNGAGVLLLHGFTGTPDSMRPVANKLIHSGFTISAPLLAGHGTTPENLARTDWTTWFHSAQKAYMELHQKCSKIFVAGLSMGALLGLQLATDYPPSTMAIGCLATPLHLKSKISRLLPFIRHTPLRHLWKYQPKFSVDVKDPEAKENFWNINLMPLSCIYSLQDLQKF